VSAFGGILMGNYDNIPEQAFYMVGDIDTVLEKAKKYAEEAAKAQRDAKAAKASA